MVNKVMSKNLAKKRFFLGRRYFLEFYLAFIKSINVNIVT